MTPNHHTRTEMDWIKCFLNARLAHLRREKDETQEEAQEGGSRWLMLA